MKIHCISGGGVPGALGLVVGVMALAVTALGQAPALAREYIRLGDRLIAIETPVAAPNVEAPLLYVDYPSPASIFINRSLNPIPMWG